MAAILLLAACASRPADSSSFVTASPSADALPCSDVLELSFQHQGSYANKFFDVTLDAVFTSPDRAERRIRGFYYGDDVWKVRFRPDWPGRWTYTYTISGRGAGSAQGHGAFDCFPQDVPAAAVQRHPDNPHRWVLADGRPYFPLGLQDCIFLGAPPDETITMHIDGEHRTAHAARTLPLEHYLSVYAQAGFTLFRFSPKTARTRTLATSTTTSSARASRPIAFLQPLASTASEWCMGSSAPTSPRSDG